MSTFTYGIPSGLLPNAPVYSSILGVKELQIIGQDRDSDWLGHSLSPFNFSALEIFDIRSVVVSSVVALMHSSGSTLRTLRLDAHVPQNKLQLRSDSTTSFGWKCQHYQRQQHSRVAVVFESAGSSELRLEDIVLRMNISGPLDRGSFRRADDAIAEMNSPHLRSVHLRMSKTGTAWSAPPRIAGGCLAWCKGCGDCFRV
ncbi:hypothetical protein B0H14DRAFT_3175924 [Mycena olivaceomarginata]|nr:hypothetical protein B0H14DRAFT_3175924 [Mycena olivaceomarginata]